MKKIAKVISTCHDCEHSITLHSKNNNYGKAYLCGFAEENMDLSCQHFLLEYTEYSGSPELLIPKQCPLEDYNPNSDRNE